MAHQGFIGPREIGRILEVLDGLGLSREAVRVPLDTCPGGHVAIEARKLVVTAPDEGLDEFLAGLAEKIAELPGAGALRRADG